MKLNLSKENFPVEYKLAFYDASQKKIISYETGPNRILQISPRENQLEITYLPVDCQSFLWKSSGVNIPLFSLRSEKSWGIGDFAGLKLLAGWAADAGLKLIQLLPINDTIATLTDKDSYPYSAMSSFALHPQFLNAEQMATRLDIAISTDEREEIARLNRLAIVEYPAVMKLKIALLEKAFDKEKKDFRDDSNWVSFLEINREWLVAYAVFCTLRDIYHTAEYSSWSEYSVYNEDAVQDFASPASPHYDRVLFWYYVQYHLHLQLADVSDYAHKKAVILKADLPIGAGRFSADTWKNPALFHMDMQAGAPPDAFSERGQNWGFPTYNMQEMEKENFAWFRSRMAHLENYFDAVRIDHVLGFFRIWSIPLKYTDARLGRFVPAIPLDQGDFISAGIDFNEERFCKAFSDNDPADIILIKDDEAGKYHMRINVRQTTSFKNLPEAEQHIISGLYDQYFYRLQNELWRTGGKKKLRMLRESTNMLLCAEDLGMVPDFTAEVLHTLHILSLEVLQMSKREGETYSDPASADYESVVTPATHDMPPIRLWWEENHSQVQVILNNFLKVSGTAPYFCEPWVCKKILERHLSSPAMWSIFLLQDIFSVDEKLRRQQPAEERINDPANANHVWNYRMHISVEQLMKEAAFNKDLKQMITENGR